MKQSQVLPFYMTYPYPMFYEEKDKMLQDLEYMQELYPEEAKRVLRYVINHLEKIDYPGSIIYDEYPDRIGIYRIVSSILNQIKHESQKNGTPLSTEKQLWIQDMIKLVLYHELFKRRHERKNGYLRF